MQPLASLSTSWTDILADVPVIFSTLKDQWLSFDSLLATAWFVLSIITAHYMARYLKPAVQRVGRIPITWRWIKTLSRALKAVVTPVISLVLMALYPPLADALLLQSHLAPLFLNLLAAWIVIRFAVSFIEYKALARWTSLFIWAIAVLNSFGLLDLVMEQLDALSFSLGKTKISVLQIVKGLIAFAVVLWLAQLLSRLIDTQIRAWKDITPSTQELLSKVSRIIIIGLLILVGLNTLGIDLTSLAVFSGALGVGIGFGLQKVVSNFISGIILLLDKSIKPGDVIAVDQTFGWVNRLSARHVSVITRDGKEHLIPNELLITERVQNWSYSDKNVRLRIDVPVSYEAEPRKALELMMQAAAATPRVLKDPKPNALLRQLGDDRFRLELRVWINDPVNGIGNVTSDILLNIWDRFQQHGINVPRPQQDVRLESGSPIEVKLLGR